MGWGANKQWAVCHYLSSYKRCIVAWAVRDKPWKCHGNQATFSSTSPHSQPYWGQNHHSPYVLCCALQVDCQSALPAITIVCGPMYFHHKVGFLLLISHAFENSVGHCACVSARFVLKSMRVKGRTQNAMFNASEISSILSSSHYNAINGAGFVCYK